MQTSLGVILVFMGMFEKTDLIDLNILKYLKVKYVCWDAVILLQGDKTACVGRDTEGKKRQDADPD